MMFRTYCDRSPNSETSQNDPSITRPPMGVIRGAPLTRPMVSKSCCLGIRTLIGLAIHR